MKTKPKPPLPSLSEPELVRAMKTAHKHAETNRALAANARFHGLRTQASARAYWWDGYATCCQTLIKRLADEKKEASG